MTVAAPSVLLDMEDWLRLGHGAGNSGIVGNQAHTYGFHRAAEDVPGTDYSRRKDPAGPNAPVNWTWATAGDFRHSGDPFLLGIAANLLRRLERGDGALGMYCEFIGRVTPGGPVLYWFRGEGTSRYTGSGHDTWFHLSKWRSMANQRSANLWVPAGQVVQVSTQAPITGFPDWPGIYFQYKNRHSMKDSRLKAWQNRMKERGWSIGQGSFAYGAVDGDFGPKMKALVTAFQKDKHLGTDGVLGPVTWRAAWTLPVT